MGPFPQATRRVECAGSDVLQLSVGTDGPFNPKMLAERVGFEPTLPFRVNTLSKRAPSATRPSLPVQDCVNNQKLTWEAAADVFDEPRTASILWSSAGKRNSRRQQTAVSTLQSANS